ncbi:MAG: HEAT repeat domain-containing protein [Planctomycetota bacterium]
MRILASAALAALMVAGQVHAADAGAGFAKEDQIREILSEAVQQYRSGRFEEAAAQFRAAIELDPDNRLIYDFYLRVGPQGLLQMQQREELADIIDRVLGRARIYQEDLRQDPSFHERLVKKLTGTEEERLVATHELVAAGPRAIPTLLKQLTIGRQDERRVWVRIVLTRMGHRAVRPLIAALEAEDPEVQQTVAALLADIGDTRALPALMRINDTAETSTVKRVAANAVAAIARGLDLGRVDETPVLYFSEALRYFRDGADVREEMAVNEALLWDWDADAGTVSSVQAPRYAWNELIAEDMLYKAARMYPDQAGYLSLLTAVQSAQLVEARQRLLLAQERTMPAEEPSMRVEAIRARVEALETGKGRTSMAGAENLCRAVKQALAAERYQVAAGLMELLRDPYLTRPKDLLPTPAEGLSPGRPGSVLVAALDHGDRTVRYQAAITLAHLDPGFAFSGSDKVMPLLAEAVGEWGMQVVLVLEPDYRYRNAAVRELQDQGYLVVAARDGFEAISRLNESPVKDAIIVAGDLGPTTTGESRALAVAEHSAPSLVAKIRSEQRWSDIPVFISLPESDQAAHAVQSSFTDVAGFMNKPFDGERMQDVIEEGTGEGMVTSDYNRDRREAVSHEAATALSSINPATTAYDITHEGMLGALAETLTQRADPIRIAALHALGQFGATQYAQRIAEVYLDQQQSLDAPVRIAFIDALGLLGVESELFTRIMGQALDHDNAEVRSAAAFAIGRASGLTTEARFDFQRQMRIDTRTIGNGISN